MKPKDSDGTNSEPRTWKSCEQKLVEAQAEADKLREQLSQSDADYYRLQEQMGLSRALNSELREQLRAKQAEFEKETLETWNRGEEIRRLREVLEAIERIENADWTDRLYVAQGMAREALKSDAASETKP